MRSSPSARRPARTLVVLAVGLLLGAALGTAHRTSLEPVFFQVLERVTGAALDSVPPDSAYVNAARGLLDRLDDPYAQLFSPEEVKRFSRQTIGDGYVGLGMVVEDQLGRIMIGRVFPGGAASELGLRPGDRLLLVNETRVDSMPLDRVTGMLLGPPGTTVAVTIERPQLKKPLRLVARRGPVHQPAIPFVATLSDDIGYVPLQRFSQTSGQELRAALSTLKRAGAKGVVIDLRGNAGGDLDAAVAISEQFLTPGQEVVTVKYRGQAPQIFRARTPALDPSVPVIVMVDGETASASEIVAGALQDHDRAVIVGTTSFGKGLVQTLYRLEEGWAVKLTTGTWLTPSGRSIQRPRHRLPDGRYVPVPDSSDGSDAEAQRPIYRSDSGRPVYGGGGITPDVVLRPDTISSSEQQLLRALRSHSHESYVALFRLALALRDSVGPDFTVRQEWINQLAQELRRPGMDMDSAVVQGGEPVLRRLLEDKIAFLAYGDSASFVRSAGRDVQLRRSLDLLRGARTPAQLLTLVDRPNG